MRKLCNSYNLPRFTLSYTGLVWLKFRREFKLFGPLHSEKLTFAAGYPKQVLQMATPSVSFAFTKQLRKIPLLSAKP